MTAFVIVTGTMFRGAETRVAKTGKPFTFATLKVPDGNAISWWKVLAFNEDAQAELARLGDGESLSAQGRLTVDSYTKGGQTRLSFTVVADHVLALRQPSKPRAPRQKQSQQSKEPRRPREAGGDLLDRHDDGGFVDPRFNDQLPF
jgi:single-stranded DNA-binding protein